MHCNHLGIAALFTAAILIVLATSAPAQIVPPPGGDDGGINPDQVIIQWPSRRYPTIQAAIDALPAHGKLLIGEGTFRIREPINIVRPITIEGAGCRFDAKSIIRARHGTFSSDIRGADNNRPFTRLRGPRPQRVVNPEATDGLFHFIGPGAGGIIKGLELVGFDAGIFVQGDPSALRAAEDSLTSVGASGYEAVTVADTCFVGNGRGILATTSAPVTVRNSVFNGNLWNAISAKSDLVAPLAIFSLNQVLIREAKNACVFYDTMYSVIINTRFESCGPGGALGAINSILSVVDSDFVNLQGSGVTLVDSTANFLGSVINHARKYGIGILRSYLLFDSGWILNTQSVINAKYGDGIDAFSNSVAHVVNSKIRSSARAGISAFGGSVVFGYNLFECNSIELAGEVFDGKSYVFSNLGGNKCGCPLTQPTFCSVQSPGLEPPTLLTNSP